MTTVLTSCIAVPSYCLQHLHTLRDGLLLHVAVQFPEAERSYMLPENGGNTTGIFSIDLTLEEIKTLRWVLGLSRFLRV